jgi:hypothetical protein
MAAGFGVGASLASMGQDQLKQAAQVLSEASNEESKRNAENKMLQAQEKQGKRQLGGTLGGAAGFAIGAQYGSAGGPWGALIGGALGTVAGGLF